MSAKEFTFYGRIVHMDYCPQAMRVARIFIEASYGAVKQTLMYLAPSLPEADGSVVISGQRFRKGDIVSINKSGSLTKIEPCGVEPWIINQARERALVAVN